MGVSLFSIRFMLCFGVFMFRRVRLKWGIFIGSTGAEISSFVRVCLSGVALFFVGGGLRNVILKSTLLVLGVVLFVFWF